MLNTSVCKYIWRTTLYRVWNLAKRRILIVHMLYSLLSFIDYCSSRNDECAETISYRQSLKKL